MMVQNRLLNILFNPGENVCISPNQYAYHALPLERVLNNDIELISDKVDPQFVDLSDICLCSINPISGSRCDDNVTAYRTFLVEMDTGTMQDQYKYIEGLGMPFSVCVFSGNKSLHFGITLDTDITCESNYRFLATWLLRIVSKSDQNCKNPSRSIRVPGHMRKDGAKKEQVLLKEFGRVPKDKFFSWLNKHEDKKPVLSTKINTEVVTVCDIPPYILKQFREGIDFSDGRNSTWFKLALSLFRAGIGWEDGYRFLSDRFTEDRDFRKKEFDEVLNKAYKRVNGVDMSGESW